MINAPSVRRLSMTAACCAITSLIFACCIQVQATEPFAVNAVVHDLTPLHDATRVLVNPYKGWYHHFPDNHPNKYQIPNDAVLPLAKGCKSWMPGPAVSIRFEFDLPASLKSGDYTLFLGPVDVREDKTRPVEFSLKESARDSEGYYRVCTIAVSSTP